MKKIIIILIAIMACFTARAQYATGYEDFAGMAGMDFSMYSGQQAQTITEEEIPYGDRLYEERMDAIMGTGLGVVSTVTGIIVTVQAFRSDVEIERRVFGATGAAVSTLGAIITGYAIYRWKYTSSELKRISASGEGIGISYSF